MSGTIHIMHAYDLFCYVLRWLLAIALGGIGWWIIIMNFAAVYVGLVRREHHSLAPLVGGFFALVGMGICPLLEVWRFAWIPVLVDIGFFITALVVGLLMQLYARKKKHNA
jgi:putative effector of murein hydrolase LrgA (UPF0299 family)